MDSIFEKLKSAVDVQQVIERYSGAEFKKGKASCPFHQERTPSLSIMKAENIFKCFGCGEAGDAVHFVAKLKGIEPLEAAKMIAADFGISEDGKRVAVTPKKAAPPPKPKVDIKGYVEQCMRDVDRTDYWQQRGLTQETIKRFNLGYDTKRDAVVVPYNRQLNYYQTRSIKDKAFFKPKTEDAGDEPLWNPAALLLKTRSPIFVTESPICAMSIMQCGGQAVSICGTAGYKKLAAAVKKKKPLGAFVITCDNDEPGRVCGRNLGIEFEALKVPYITANVSGEEKDPNDLLRKNAGKLAANVAAAIDEARKLTASDYDTYTAAELMTMKLEPPIWIVDEMLPQGLSMIAAPSKMGKSWACMQLCCAVAGGKKFLDRTTNACDCWYLALEDGKYRMQDRLRYQLGEQAAPRNMHISHKAPTLDNNKLLDLFAEKLDENPRIKLIIVDTFQKVRSRRPKSADAYMADYADLTPLKEFADDNKICILLIHHLRKMTDDGDPFNMILGSVGIPGALDTMLVITKKNRADEEAKLFTTGRDISQQELIVKMSKETKFKWENVGTAEEQEIKRHQRAYEQNSIVQTVRALLKQASEWRGTTTEFIKASCDLFGELRIEAGAARLGRQIADIEAELYRNDGIDHKASRSGEKRIHHFFPKKAWQPSATYEQSRFDA